jgi:pimeloyl-ACP methyl ester carboxylesterase
MFRTIEFLSEGAVLKGRLYLPPGLPTPLPLIIMAHGFSATMSGMVADQYAEVFCNAGFAVLLYDHRNFGYSAGEPRQEINKWIQARGYRDAINFVSTLPEIDSARIALWGDSLSGAEVIGTGSIDPRVVAIIAQVPACGDELPPSDPDGAQFAAFREAFLNSDLSGSPETATGLMPVVSFDQRSTPSLLPPLTAFRWFIEYGGRYGTRWENSATVVAPTTAALFHPVLCAPHLQAALLMVIAQEDEMPGARSEIARAVYQAAPEPKELVEIDGGHFGLLYYPSPLFDQASQVQTDFLRRYL